MNYRDSIMIKFIDSIVIVLLPPLVTPTYLPYLQAGFFFSSICLTTSAELMKSKFVRRPSVVRDTIISEPNAWISFKFHLWLLLDSSQNQFFSSA